MLSAQNEYLPIAHMRVNYTCVHMHMYCSVFYDSSYIKYTHLYLFIYFFADSHCDRKALRFLHVNLWGGICNAVYANKHTTKAMSSCLPCASVIHYSTAAASVGRVTGDLRLDRDFPPLLLPPAVSSSSQAPHGSSRRHDQQVLLQG